MWQYGLVDTFTAVNFIYNAGVPYLFWKIIASSLFLSRYLDWLVIKLRPIRKQPIFQTGLNIKTFVMFLQFLTYVQDFLSQFFLSKFNEHIFLPF